MQFTKIDAGLANTLSDPTPSRDEEIHVSVRVSRPLTHSEQSEFHQLGGIGVDSGLPVLTAKLTLEAIDKLSEKPWVRSLTLSRPSKPS